MTFWRWERKCFGCVHWQQFNSSGWQQFHPFELHGSHNMLCVILLFEVVRQYFLSDLSFDNSNYGASRWFSRARGGRVRATPECSASPRLLSPLKIGLNSPWQLASWKRRTHRQPAHFLHSAFTRSTCTSPRTCAPHGSAQRLAHSGAPCALFSQTPKEKK